MKIGYVNPPYRGVQESYDKEYNLVWMSMKSYYKIHGKHEYEWVWPNEDVTDCDVVLFSSYMWNSKQCEEIAKKCRGVKIVGGPHIDFNNPLLFELSSYDFFCQPTMSGEVFITEFLDRFAEGEVDPKDIPFEKRSVRKERFEWLNFSVYEDNIDWLRFAAKDNDKPITLETTRGCPFKCTYCEWGGGLATKIVQKPIEVVKKDIDVIASLGIKQIELADSNTGAFLERDTEILRHIYERGMEVSTMSIVKTPNLERKFQIIKNSIDIGFVPSLGLQTYSRDALKATKRTDLSRKDQNKLIEMVGELVEEDDIELELILGLPGSTKEDFYQEFQWIETTKAWGFPRFEYVILPFTEAATKEDKEKHGVKTTLVESHGNVFETIVSCNTYSKEDMIEMFIMNQLGKFVREIFVGDDIVIFMKTCFQAIQELNDFETLEDHVLDYLEGEEPKPSGHLNGIPFGTYYFDFFQRNKQQILEKVIHAL